MFPVSTSSEKILVILQVPASSASTGRRLSLFGIVSCAILGDASRGVVTMTAGAGLPLGVLAALSAALVAQAPPAVPRIWDDAALADWATPVAALNLRPAHYSSAEYYSVPGDNLRTYPIYHPDSEPAGYWEELNKKKPEPL